MTFLLLRVLIQVIQKTLKRKSHQNNQNQESFYCLVKTPFLAYCLAYCSINNRDLKIFWNFFEQKLIDLIEFHLWVKYLGQSTKIDEVMDYGSSGAY